ncbi:MAG TPA: DUF2092 domain-containing protein [Myxococcota bacterium]|nr:DUF2092 domain-containing protein [Myxococcota bacterium]
MRRALARMLCIAALVGVALAAHAGAKKPAAPKGDPPVIEPKAVEILKAACTKLASARTLAFTAVVYYENPSSYGAPLVYTTKSAVALQRPDKLRVITSGDGPANEFFYDGKNMTAVEPGSNLAAVAPAPPTIDAALQTAFQSAAIYFPFTDLIVANPYEDISDGLRLAFYIGQSTVVGGTTTDMVAYGNDDVFVQVWIGAEDHLPRLVRAVYSNDPAQLRNALELSNWQLDVALAADAFEAKSAANAGKIAFARPDAKPKAK